MSLIAACFLAGIAAAHGGWFAFFAALLLAAGLIGFLPFNFPPLHPTRARIFMGDVGSQFCGFVLAMLGVVASRFDGVELPLLLMPMLPISRGIKTELSRPVRERMEASMRAMPRLVHPYLSPILATLRLRRW